MGMGGTDGPKASRRRRLVAGVIVTVMLLAALATVFTLTIG
jgi:hypothetical protein